MVRWRCCVIRNAPVSRWCVRKVRWSAWILCLGRTHVLLWTRRHEARDRGFA